MKVAWLHDKPSHPGGAELTQAEFRAAAPEGVEVTESLDADVAVVHNCMSYPQDALEGFSGRVVRYHHDLAHAPLDDRLAERATHLFCSPLQVRHHPLDGECIPPALDLEPFEALRSSNHRHGNVCVGRMSYGKGAELLAEYVEPVDVYSTVPIPSEGSVRYRGATTDAAKTLSAYERFVFLPTAIEPFGRAVVEAWAAGLTLVVNGNVGAVHWIANAQEKLASAAEDFWAVVLGD